jgi:ABC-2 type transport system permease protein
VQAFQAELLARYKVDKVEDLPINFRGASYEWGEQLSTDLYNRHFDRLYDAYRRQGVVQRVFAVVSPAIALQPWSRAFAGTDFGNHLAYLRGVEDYRYRLIQRLNGWMKEHKPPRGERYIFGDIATITRDVVYAPRQESLAGVASAQTPNLAVLLLWTSFALGLVSFSAFRLGRR